ncbi:hypothetical protein [Actinomadura gamaensis]|uniref:Uncharacterized protein n=1 Tax=Actinomadura gamaensis TaxID=1763541 RepID=A0ABV9TQN4_9ACTN
MSIRIASLGPPGSAGYASQNVPASGRSVAVSGSPQGVARAEMERERSAVAAVQARHPGAMVWFGAHTGRWWAVLGGCLVEADDPAGLARAFDIIAPEVRRRGSGGRNGR